MTKTSFDLWSENFLNNPEFFLFQKYLKKVRCIDDEQHPILNYYYFATLQKKCLLTKHSLFKSKNAGILHISGMVIPTKVDTSHASQQNVNWMSTVKTQIS